MPELIFELGCEEIPADDLFILTDAMKRIAGDLFTSNRLVWTNLETEATPRRLTLCAEIEPQQQDLREQKMGPPRKVAVDPAGQPTPAGLGFAKNAGIPFRKLQFVTTPKGEYLSAEILLRGKPTASVLKGIIPQVVSQLPFHKFMRWNSSDFVFGRPIRSILCLFAGKVIPLQIAGVKSGKHTFGHRFLGKKKLEVTT